MNTYTITSFPGAVRSAAAIPAVIQDELWAAEQCREAINCLERALLAPPLQFRREINTASRSLNHLRARINAWLCQERKNLDPSTWKKTLSHLDAVQELLNEVQSPSALARRKPVEQARQILQDILLDGFF